LSEQPESTKAKARRRRERLLHSLYVAKIRPRVLVTPLLDNLSNRVLQLQTIKGSGHKHKLQPRYRFIVVVPEGHEKLS
jgi:hypothetical protein